MESYILKGFKWGLRYSRCRPNRARDLGPVIRFTCSGLHSKDSRGRRGELKGSGMRGPRCENADVPRTPNWSTPRPVSEWTQLSTTLQGTFPVAQVQLPISLLPQTDVNVTDESGPDIDSVQRTIARLTPRQVAHSRLVSLRHAHFFPRSHTRMQAPIFTHMTNDYSHMGERAQRDALPWYNGIFHLANSVERQI